MNNWKKSYSRDNWAQQVDEEKEKRLETQKRDENDKLFEILDHEKDERKRKVIIEKLLKNYNFLQYESDNFSKEDRKSYEYLKRELEKAKLEMAKMENDEMYDSESWKEYYEEEKMQDEKDGERDEI